MLIHALGPLSVTDGGLPVDVGPPRVRRALARLLVDAGALVSVDALTDAVWAGAPLPKRPEKAVQDLIADLRRSLPGGGQRVRTGPDGRAYRLVLQPSEYDAALAAWDLADGLQAVAARDLPRSLALFNAVLDRFSGRPFDGYDEPFALAEIRRLEELRQDAVEGRLAALVALGSPVDISEFVRATAAAPVRWRSWAAWMLWFAGAGRPADALRTFQDAVRAFGDIGLDPPRSLRDLDARIARDDADLGVDVIDVLGVLYGAGSTHRVSPVLAESIGVRLVGRDRELARLRAAWTDCLRHGRSVVQVMGEEGSGKSSLVGVFAREVATNGGLVLAGRAPQVMTSSYQPIAEALGAHAHDHPAEAAMVLATDPSIAPLHRIVASLPVDSSTVAVAVNADANAERQAMFAAASAYLGGLAATGPVLLVLDDLHWIDPATAQLLEHVLLALDQRHRVLVVLAYRDDEIRPSHPLQPVLADVARLPVERIELKGLAADQLAELIRMRFPDVADPVGLGESLARVTEGNALFVEEVLRQLEQLRESAVVMDHHLLDHLRVPDGIRALVLRRLGALDPTTARVLAAAAVIGQRFSVTQLESCDVGSRAVVLDALDAATAAGLLVDPGDGSPDMMFRHGFYRGVLYDGLLGVRRADLHLRIGRWLRQHGAADRTVAHHFLAAGALGDLTETTGLTCAAARRAAAQLDIGDARSLVARLLELLAAESPAPRGLQARATYALAEAERLSGDVSATKAAALAAWDHARASGDIDLLVDAAIEHATFGSGRRTDDETSIDLLHRSLGMVTELRHRARLLSRIGYHHAMWTPGTAEAIDSAREGLALAEQLDDDEVTAFALWAAAAALQGGPTAVERRQLGRRLLAVVERSGDDRARANAYRVLVLSSLELGDAARADAVIDEMNVVAQRTRSWIYAADVARWRAMRAMSRGEWSVAREEADRQRTISGGVSIYPASWAAQRAFLHRAAGELPEARLLLEQAVSTLADLPALAAFRAVLALVAAELGDDDVRDNHFWALADDGLSGVHAGRTYSTAIASLAEVCALMGERSVAPLLLDALYPFAGQLVVVSWGEACLGAADRYRGMLLGTLGRTDDAVAALQAGCELERAAGAPALVAQSHMWLDRIRVSAGR